jgi:mannose-6-phosphate isomerase-like protein (cupin superfamily)
MSTTIKNFTHVDLGKFSGLTDKTADGRTKKFMKADLGLTGMEISVTRIDAGGKTPFFHSHKQNEELYIVVEGSGQMQLDDHVIDVKEGSMVNVAPKCSRALRASAKEALTYLCVQAKENSLEQYSKEDGVRHEDHTWKN